MAKQAEKNVTVEDLKQEKAAKSAKNRAGGGKDVEVSILDTVNVRFTKNFKLMKKGTEARVSQFMYELYLANNCVEKIG